MLPPAPVAMAATVWSGEIGGWTLIIALP